eukprot:66673-Rhodomonas_salina.9
MAAGKWSTTPHVSTRRSLGRKLESIPALRTCAAGAPGRVEGSWGLELLARTRRADDRGEVLDLGVPQRTSLLDTASGALEIASRGRRDTHRGVPRTYLANRSAAEGSETASRSRPLTATAQLLLLAQDSRSVPGMATWNGMLCFQKQRTWRNAHAQTQQQLCASGFPRVYVRTGHAQREIGSTCCLCVLWALRELDWQRTSVSPGHHTTRSDDARHRTARSKADNTNSLASYLRAQGPGWPRPPCTCTHKDQRDSRGPRLVEAPLMSEPDMAKQVFGHGASEYLQRARLVSTLPTAPVRPPLATSALDTAHHTPDQTVAPTQSCVSLSSSCPSGSGVMSRSPSPPVPPSPVPPPPDEFPPSGFGVLVGTGVVVKSAPTLVTTLAVASVEVVWLEIELVVFGLELVVFGLELVVFGLELVVFGLELVVFGTGLVVIEAVVLEIAIVGLGVVELVLVEVGVGTRKTAYLEKLATTIAMSESCTAYQACILAAHTCRFPQTQSLVPQQHMSVPGSFGP